MPVTTINFPFNMERLTIDHLNIEQWTGLEKWHLKYSEKKLRKILSQLY